MIFCAYNGVVAQGVTQTGGEVAAMVAPRICGRHHPCLSNGPAMTREQAEQAILAGALLAEGLQGVGRELFGHR